MWETTRIADLGSVITGKTPSSNNPEQFGDDHPFITPTDIGTGRIVHTGRGISQEGYLAFRRQILPRWSVCFVCIGATIGKICLTTEESLTNQQINSVVVDTTRHDPFFVYYLLSTYADAVKAIAGGAATPIVNKTSFENIEVIVPPLSTQRKIAAILSVYDDLIENNLRRIKILEEMAQNLYREWFVKFRFPGHEKVKMVDSRLGKIPEGWETTTIDEMCEYISRGISPKYSENSECRVINQRCVRDNRLQLEFARGNTKQVPEEKFVRFGDVLINSTGVGTLGRVTQVYRSPEKHTVDSHVTIVRPLAGVDRDYFGWSLIQLQPDFERLGTGATGQTELNRTSIAKTELMSPPLSIQNGFGGKVYPMRSLVEILRSKNDNLRQTRDLLLPKLISGEVDVSELDITIPEANA